MLGVGADSGVSVSTDASRVLPRDLDEVTLVLRLEFERVALPALLAEVSFTVCRFVYGGRALCGDGGGISRGISCSGSSKPLSIGSASNSQLNPSKKPRISVVSDCEKRSADDGSAMGGGGGGGGKNSEMAGSKVNSKSENGTGGE